MATDDLSSASADTASSDGLVDGGGTSSLLHAEPAPRRSRRELLTRAGVATVASVGALTLLDQRRAEAATGGNFVLGAVNDAGATTELKPTTAGTKLTLFKVDGSPLTSTSTTMETISPGGLFSVGIDASTALGGDAIYAHATGTSTTTGIAVNGVGSDAFSYGLAASGGLAQMYIAPKGAAGAPTSGDHAVGEVYVDSKGVHYHCLVGGTSAVWAPVLMGGSSIMQSVTTTQPTLTGSDGVNWTQLGPVSLTLTPTFNCLARCTGNADLFTNTSGINQDIAIFISGGSFGSGKGTLLSWKESGGFAGIYSPNAAYVDGLTTSPLVAGTSYTIALYWKTNKPQGGGIIYAGAGSGSPYSPTRLVVQLIPS